jgi:hypothetical protein
MARDRLIRQAAEEAGGAINRARAGGGTIGDMFGDVLGKVSNAVEKKRVGDLKWGFKPKPHQVTGTQIVQALGKPYSPSSSRYRPKDFSPEPGSPEYNIMQRAARQFVSGYRRGKFNENALTPEEWQLLERFADGENMNFVKRDSVQDFVVRLGDQFRYLEQMGVPREITGLLGARQFPHWLWNPKSIDALKTVPINRIDAWAAALETTKNPNIATALVSDMSDQGAKIAQQIIANKPNTLSVNAEDMILSAEKLAKMPEVQRETFFQILKIWEEGDLLTLTDTARILAGG